MISKGMGYVQGRDQRAGVKLGAHLRYIQYRAQPQRDPEIPMSEDTPTTDERALFSATQDDVTWREAKADVLAHGSQAVAYHKIVLSPSDREREGLGDDAAEWRSWTREVMADLAAEKGGDLTWYAGYHTNTDHPHVHVVVGGGQVDPETGEHRPVRIDLEDYGRLTTFGQEHVDLELIDLTHDVLEQSMAWEMDRDPAEPDRGHGIDIGDRADD